MKKYLYRIELLEELEDGQECPYFRAHYLSRSAAIHRVAVLSDHGIKAEVQRSNPITWAAA